jgi:FkbH-like protein
MFPLQNYHPIEDNHSHEERERCLELLQRSNQFNISKEKRSEDDYNLLYENNNVSLYGLRVNDKYGDYGIIGFVSISDDNHTHHLLDFVMSCRVAQKKVERAFFNWLVGQYNTGDVLNIVVNKTDRNMPLRDELNKMPFIIVTNTDDKICFSYQKGCSHFIDDDVVEVNGL